MRGECQDAALAENSATRAVLGQLDTTEMTALDVRDAVVTRQPLIEKGVSRSEQLDHTSILANDTAEEQLGLTLERDTQGIVESSYIRVSGPDVLKISEQQPLGSEVLRQRVGSRIREHSPDLTLQHLWFSKINWWFIATLPSKPGSGQGRPTAHPATRELSEQKSPLRPSSFVVRTRGGGIAHDYVSAESGRRKRRRLSTKWGRRRLQAALRSYR